MEEKEAIQVLIEEASEDLLKLIFKEMWLKSFKHEDDDVRDDCRAISQRAGMEFWIRTGVELKPADIRD